MTDRGWGRAFDDPIIIPGRRPLRTLRDVAKFLMGMTPRERIEPHWLDAIEAVILVVERNGPTMLATSRRKIDVFEPLVNGVEQSKTRRGGRRAVKSAMMIART